VAVYESVEIHTDSVAPRPPQPRMPKLAQFALMAFRTIPFLEWCHRRLGDCFAVWMPPWGRLVYIADPDEIKRVFTGNPKQFHAGEANALVLERVLGKHSLLVLDEDEHLTERKRLLPHFHGESVRRYADTMAEIAAAEIDTWPAGKAVKMRPAMQRIGLETILRAVIGVTEPGRLGRLRQLLPQVSSPPMIVQALMFIPVLERVGIWKRYLRMLEETDRLLYEEIAARRADPSGEDILSLLVANTSLSDQQLRDELLTLLVAGHETTANGLAWALERLARHPARSTDDDYLDAVVKETLRVRPIVSDVVRTLQSEAEVGGYRLPAGTVVLPAIALVQRDTRRYGADAREFRPERWLDGSPPPYAWIPFGGGVRRCIGASFAQVEMRTVLREVLRRVRLRAPTQRPERGVIRHVTVVPGRGARAIVDERLAVEPAAELAGAHDGRPGARDAAGQVAVGRHD
jgi:cytochrome P450 family 135